MRLCFFGDSLVNGTCDPACLGWVGRVCANARETGYDVTVYNLGIRKNTSSDVLQRWHRESDQRLPADSPSSTIFSFGINDCAVEDGRLRVAPDQSIINARAILAVAQSLRPILMIGPAPIADEDMNERTRNLSITYERLCSELAVPYLQVFEHLLASDEYLDEVRRGDGSHPGAMGYDIFARLIIGWSAWRELLRTLGDRGG